MIWKQMITGGIMMINAPEIAGSTAEERRAFIKTKYPCIADCDMCGLCKVFRGKDADCVKCSAAKMQNTLMQTI